MIEIVKTKQEQLKERILKLESYVVHEENEILKQMFQNELKFAREELKRMEV